MLPRWHRCKQKVTLRSLPCVLSHIMRPATSCTPIQRLQRQVIREVQRSLHETRTTGDTLPIEITEAAKGRRVYHQRNQTLTVMLFVAAFYFLTRSSWPTQVCALATMYSWYDFYSGVLHVVLDEPSNLQWSPLRAGVYEFLWHHRLPHDIASKSFVEVCGDLNAFVIGNLFYHGSVLLFFMSPRTRYLYLSLLGAKMLVAYFGQYCHRCAHQPSQRLPRWVRWAQRRGWMVSPAKHRQHHRGYDRNFCIGSGASNAFVNRMFTLWPSQRYAWLWLVLFVALTAFDLLAWTTMLSPITFVTNE